MEASGIHQKEVPSGGDIARDALEGVGHGNERKRILGTNKQCRHWIYVGMQIDLPHTT
jgi:hypothetical protein